MALFRNTKRIFGLLSMKQKVEFALLVLMMIVGAFGEMLAVLLLGELVSIVMDPGIYETNNVIESICDTLGISSYSNLVFFMGIAVIAVYFGKNAYLTLEYYLQNRYIYQKRLQTQGELARSYLYKNYEYYITANTDEILQVMNEDIINGFSLFLSVMNAYTELVTAAILFLTILLVSPSLAVFVTLVLAAVMLFILRMVRPTMSRAGRDKIAYWPMQNRWLMQALGGAKEMKIAGNEEYFLENFRANSRKYTEADRRSAFWQNIPRLLIESFGISAVVAFMLFYVLRGNDIASFIPVLTVFVAAAYRLLPCMTRMTSYLNTISYAEPFLTDLLGQMSKARDAGEEEEQPGGGEARDFRFEGRIEVRDICYRYPGSPENVLDHASVSIAAGQSVGIVGASGGGKTTLVDVMLGLLKPQEGAVLVDGRDVREVYRGWLSCVAYIPQTIFMLNDTIRANVVFGSAGGEGASDGDVWEALEEAQLADFVRSLPDGLDSEIGERGVRLSGGQRQRIGIARALLTRAGVLVFDEATSALDNETEAAIMESISRLHGKKTMIIIAHRLQTIRDCDAVYQVEGGRVERVRDGDARGRGGAQQAATNSTGRGKPS